MTVETSTINPHSNSSTVYTDDTEVQVRLKETTKDIHKKVESHPFLQAIFRTKTGVSDKAYCQYLIDLEQVYQALEEGLISNDSHPFISPLCIPDVYRSEAIRTDVDAFFPEGVFPSAAAIQYQNHLMEISKERPHLLIAHAYARYLGDLAGGQIIQRFIKKLWPDKECCAFYNFQDWLDKVPEAKKIWDLKDVYRDILNTLPLTELQKVEVANEGLVAFQYAEEMLDAILTVPKWEIRTLVGEENVHSKLCQAIEMKDFQLLKCALQYLNTMYKNLSFTTNDTSSLTVDIFSGDLQISTLSLLSKPTGSMGIFENGVELKFNKNIIAEQGVAELKTMITNITPFLFSIALEKGVSSKECHEINQTLTALK
jgi:heme oxygenase (biliverdin-producing, ferredoxin)